MLVPKKRKYNKTHRGRGRGLKGIANVGFLVVFGEFGMKATTRGEIDSRQIESARRVINRHLKRTGKVWIRVFPHKPITRKAAEVPMGSGKGSVEFYVVPVLPGAILFEIGGCSEELAREAIELASHKLSVKTKFYKNDF